MTKHYQLAECEKKLALLLEAAQAVLGILTKAVERFDSEPRDHKTVIDFASDPWVKDGLPAAIAKVTRESQ